MSSIPGTINYSAKERFFDRGVERYYLESIHEKINALKKIEITASSLSPVISRFNSELFWQELSQHASDKETINHLETIWRQIAPFSHLSLQALWQIKTTHIQPLFSQAEALKKELEAEWQITDGHFTPAQSLHLKQIEISKSKVDGLLRDIGQFEIKLQNSIYARLSLCKLNNNHKLDAPITTIAEEINKLNIIAKLGIPKEQHGIISDDLRTCFYDWLVNANPARKEYFDSIIEPINQKGFMPVVANSEMAQNKKSFAEFYEDITNKLLVSAVAKKKHFDTQRFLATRIATKLSNLLLPRPIVKSLQVMWFARWAVLQGILAGVYFWGAAVLLAPVAATIGLSLSVATNIAFYTIVMLPTWVMAYKACAWVKDTISDWLIRPKKTQIFQALDILDETEQLIRTELSQGILDISHYDIKAHTNKVEGLIDKLAKTKVQLQSSWFWQRVFFKAELAVGSSVAAKIGDTISHIKAAQALIAANIAKRLPSHLKQLHKNHCTNQIEPMFPVEQFKHLALYINKFGNESAQNNFLLNTHMTAGLVKSLSKQKCLIISPNQSAVNAPWGAHLIDRAALNGWQILINCAQHAGPQKQAAHRLIKLLKGEQAMSLSDLEQVIIKLAPNDFDNTLKHVQNHLFLCLSHYPYEYAALLSGTQKQRIASWQQANEALIKSAHSFIGNAVTKDGPDINLISSKDETELVKYFKAFEGSLIASASKGDSILGVQNKVKEFLAHDDGSNPKALYLARFIPKQSKTSIIDQLAKRRLTWLIAHCASEPDITDVDIELFYHPALNEKQATFKANAQVRQHTKFSGDYDESFLTLLSKLKDCGLLSTALIARYKALHDHERSVNPVTPQFSAKEAPHTCRQQVRPNINAPQSSRRAGCA